MTCIFTLDAAFGGVPTWTFSSTRYRYLAEGQFNLITSSLLAMNPALHTLVLHGAPVAAGRC